MREQGAGTIGAHDRHGHLAFASSKGSATTRRVDVRLNVREWRGIIALRVFPDREFYPGAVGSTLPSSPGNVAVRASASTLSTNQVLLVASQAGPIAHTYSCCGVSCMEDVYALKKIGCSGVIIGKAFYENRITLEELKKI